MEPHVRRYLLRDVRLVGLSLGAFRDAKAAFSQVRHDRILD
jgi:hypothetical protein